MSNRMIADYRCLRCSHEWSAPAGPENGQCPKCGHLYAKWLNYGSRPSVEAGGSMNTNPPIEGDEK